ncbi:MAG: type IV pilus modification PilV family protein [Actinomycetota bacterium]
MRRLGHRHSEAGFSLVETLAALVVFSIVTLGIVPVLLTSVRGSHISRSHTQGKNVGLEAMERARSLPYYIDYGTQARRVDVLDMYFPNLTPYSTGTCAGYFIADVACASTGHSTSEDPGYLTTCPAAGAPVCPTGLPAGYTVTYQASFIQDEAPADADPETYNRVPPPAGYAYNLVGSDNPPQLVMELTITTRWTLGGRDRSYQLRTLIGDRQFGDLRIRASARVDYAFSVVAGFGAQGSEEVTDGVATAGFSESQIEAQRLSTADHTSRAIELRLVNADPTQTTCPPSPCPGDDRGNSPLTGAQAIAAAPPDVTGVTGTAGDLTLTHPHGNYGVVMRADDSGAGTVAAVDAVTAGGTPRAEGEGHSAQGSSGADLAVFNRRAHNDFGLQTDEATVEVVKKPSGVQFIASESSAVTNALGSGVDAEASTEFGEMRLFPTTFVTDNTHDGAVVAITDFTATIDCAARTNGTAVTPTVSYSAILHYWFDPIEDDLTTTSTGGPGNIGVQYISVPLSLSGGTDPLVGVKTSNPLVYDRNSDVRDIYLFPRTSAPAREGYLSNWSSLTTATTSVADAGRSVTANLDGAIDIETGGIEKDIANTVDPNTALGISIGALSCSAEDRR